MHAAPGGKNITKLMSCIVLFILFFSFILMLIYFAVCCRKQLNLKQVIDFVRCFGHCFFSVKVYDTITVENS